MSCLFHDDCVSFFFNEKNGGSGDRLIVMVAKGSEHVGSGEDG